MAEMLGRRLEHERRSESIPCLRITSRVKKINHSQFTDDILLIGGASSIMAGRFKLILDQFLLVSRGAVNNTKCFLYTWNTNARSLVVIARTLQFPMVTNWRSFKYLRIPICLNSLSIVDWYIILSKIRENFTLWGAQWLNLTGMLILVKVVLLDLPIFQYSSMLAPMEIKRAVAPELRKFLWEGGKSNHKCFHLVNWQVKQALKAHGGLRVKDPILANLALEPKMLW